MTAINADFICLLQVGEAALAGDRSCPYPRRAMLNPRRPALNPAEFF
jgi:hypothetical protein